MRTTTVASATAPSHSCKRHLSPSPRPQTEGDVLASAFTVNLSMDEAERRKQREKAPATYNAFSVVKFSDPRLAAIKMSPAVRAAVERSSSGIFNSHVTPPTTSSSVDELVIQTDGDQRRQSIYSSNVPPPEDPNKEAVNLVPEREAALMKKWEASVMPEVLLNVQAVVPNGLQVMASTIICNVLKKGQAAKSQQLHCDVTPLPPPSPDPAPVIILAVDKFYLQVCPGSHKAVQSMMALDKACEGLSAEARRAAFNLLPTSAVVLLELRPGDMVVMHGYCVHGGYKPRLGALDIRAHWYCQMEGSTAFVYNETYNIEGQEENPLRTLFNKDFVAEKVRG